MGFKFVLDTLFCFVWLLLLLMVAVLCAPTPQVFLTAIAVIGKFVGNQSELILQRTYSEKELSFKVICEKLPTLFLRDRRWGGGVKIYSKRCFSDQSDCRTDFCKLLFNYLPNQ